MTITLPESSDCANKKNNKCKKESLNNEPITQVKDNKYIYKGKQEKSISMAYYKDQ